MLKCGLCFHRINMRIRFIPSLIPSIAISHSWDKSGGGGGRDVTKIGSYANALCKSVRRFYKKCIELIRNTPSLFTYLIIPHSTF